MLYGKSAKENNGIDVTKNARQKMVESLDFIEEGHDYHYYHRFETVFIQTEAVEGRCSVKQLL